MLIFSHIICFSTISIAQNYPVEVYQIEAALLYRFAQNTEWPSSHQSEGSTPLTFCVSGEDPFEGALDDIASSNTVGGRKITVRHAVISSNINGCHILYISQTQRSLFTDILSKSKGSGVLTVSDIPDFTSKGGMVEFTVVNEQVRFIINLKKTNEEKIKLSGQLVEYADRLVKE